ncbi:MAG: TolC family protein, partial [Acidobacteriota bacterium]
MFTSPRWRMVLIGAMAQVFGGWFVGQAAEVGSPTYRLDEVIELAMQHNPGMAEVQAKLAYVRGQQIAAGAYLNPSISAQSGRGAIRDPSSSVAVIERAVTVEQPVEWMGKRRSRMQAAEAGLAGAQAGVEEAQLNIMAEVKIAFYQLLLAQRDVELAKQNLATVEELAQVVRTRVSAGEAARFDILKADVEVQKARKELARAKNEVSMARAGLNAVTGWGLGQAFRIEGDFEVLDRKLDLDALISRKLEQHPTSRRFHKVLEQAEHKVSLERESLIPNVSFQGTYHREAGDEAWLAGLSVRVPLWYQRQGEILSAVAEKRRAEAESRMVRNELVKSVVQYAQKVQTAQAQIEVFEKGLLKQAEEALRIVRLSLREG